MTPSQKLRSIADSTGLDGIANAIREVANEIDAPAVPQGEPINRPQNCGTSFCSCIECVCEPEPVTLTDERLREKEAKATP